jgi:SAM-dependent methyltransferase
VAAQLKPARKRRISPIQFTILLYGSIVTVLTLAHWPYATDDASRPSSGKTKPAEAFYAAAYDGGPDSAAGDDDPYVKTAAEMAERFRVKPGVADFVNRYGLERARVLDVGAGRGYLQDIVQDYVGLDISPTARRFFHKPFVRASATDMPFRDNEFDAAWTVWVLEHVPQPERMLSEMRRVIKPGGLLLLWPAWFCTSWAADGYNVRPYSDFGLPGKLVKASIPVRASYPFSTAYVIPTRAIRTLASALLPGPTSFHYRRLTPNYKQYWEPDSDAVNSLDPHEALLWFRSRGDECLNCRSSWEVWQEPTVMVIRVKASESAARASR